MKKLLILIPLILLLVVVGWRIVVKTRSDAASKALAASKKNAPTYVTVSVAKARYISQQIQAVGTLESPFKVQLSPNVAGRIDYLQVREGDAVNPGQVLVRIDPQEVEGEIVQAQATLAQAEQKLAQAKITEDSTAVGIYSAVNQNKAMVAGAGADYNETALTYKPTVDAAHEATLDNVAKVKSASSQVEFNQANLHSAEANLEDASAKYAREMQLYQQGYAAPQDVDDAKASEKVYEATVNAQQKTVDAARSAQVSAEAELKAAENQESIARKKGMSDLQDAKAKLTQSDATLKTAVSNRAQIPAYAESLRALESAVVAAKGALDQAIARRAYLIVKSSVEGTVTQRLADPGAEASPGSPLLVVQFLKWVYFTAAIPVENADAVKPGQAVTVSIDEVPGKVFHTKIADVNRAADPTSRQFMVRVELDNASHDFRPGMFGHLDTRSVSVSAPVTVPREAVTQLPGGSYTATVVDSSNVAHVTPIKIGVQDTNDIQILDGVKAGDRVVTLSYRPVKNKGKVMVGHLGNQSKHQSGDTLPAGTTPKVKGMAPKR
jgi:RND family efflux transporter MFP subunit